MVQEFLSQLARGVKVAPPSIVIEVSLIDEDVFARLHGAHNLEKTPLACPGLRIIIEPDPDSEAELMNYFSKGMKLIPIEFYRVEWRSFADALLVTKPKAITAARIDSTTIRSTSGIDYHLREMLDEHLQPEDRAKVAIAFREVKELMTDNHLKEVNDKISKIDGPLSGEQLALAMDHSSRASWNSSVIPHIADIPFAMSGQGQQAAVKIALAMGRSAESARVATIEEPENHLSHASLNKLLSKIQSLMSHGQQLFITTHSSYVLNRLGLDKLQFVSDGDVKHISGISDETARYFQKLPGYDTLRIVLSERCVLVEGPSDEMIFERFYFDKFGKRPIEDRTEVISVRGLSHRRFMELAKLLNKRCSAIRDLDKSSKAEIEVKFKDLTEPASRQLFVGSLEAGETLEPQLLHHNSEDSLRSIMGIKKEINLLDWMTDHKTESAIRIAESPIILSPPTYIAEAIAFIHG
jgi:ABC-type ATPase involved in cell division